MPRGISSEWPSPHFARRWSAKVPVGASATVRVTKPGFARAIATLSAVRVGAAPVATIVLERPTPIDGSVVDQLGEPIVGARATLQREETQSSFLESRTGEDGRFSFPEATAGEWTLRFFPVTGSDAYVLPNDVVVTGGAHATFYDDVTQDALLRVSKVGSTTSVAVFLGAFSGTGGSTGGGAGRPVRCATMYLNLSTLAVIVLDTGLCAAAPPIVCSTKKPSSPSSRSTVTWSSPNPVLRMVVVRSPATTWCVPSIVIVSANWLVQRVIPSAKFPEASAR